MYKINPINNFTDQILDEFDGCIYLIKGDKKALVIDTGMSREKLKPYIDQLVSTPYQVVFTHGHVDHIGQSKDFDNIYMSHLDLDVYKEHMKENNDPNDRFNTIGLSFQNPSSIKNIHDGEIISLGDHEVLVVSCFGHTPGSLLFVDLKEHTVFTGDAIGSGCGVWMQVDFALHLKDYYQSLKNAISILESHGVDESWLFLGGHAYQEYQSRVSDYNRLDINLMKDMMTLCKLLLRGNASYQEVITREFSTGKPYYARYNKAEMIFTLGQLK